jgi:diketogulonate reductase-like aldo/keto reductase
MNLRIDTRLPMPHGGSIPAFGLGTWEMHGKKAVEAIKHALDLGCRLIDTASMYDNEAEVGEAIRASGVPRGDVFLTTKVWNTEQGYEPTLRACAASLKRLGTDYVDLYLIHSPSGRNRQETWRALLKLHDEGKARAIGVSNYGVRHLEEVGTRPVTPAVNQIELSPFLQARDIVEACRARGIVVEAYSPLTRGERLRDKRIAAIAAKHGKTAAQVLLRWGLQHGFVEIPKSARPERVRENADVFDFSLAAADMKALDALDEDHHVAWNPTKAP